MIQFLPFHYSRRDSSHRKMKGLWLWAILRAPQSVWQGYTTKCLPLSCISRVRLEIGQSVVSGYLMRLPHGLSDMCMPRLRLLALKGYGTRVVDVLFEHMYNIGWCIVGRQAIQREMMLALDLREMGATCAS